MSEHWGWTVLKIALALMIVIGWMAWTFWLSRTKR